MQALKRLATVGAAVLALALAGCGGSQEEETTPVGESTGEQIEQGVMDAGEQTGEAVEDAGQAVEEGVDATGEAIEDTTD